jgi:tetratricopeptide (TPR) repeat protein
MSEQEEKNIDLIEAYAKGALTASDLSDFEKRRSADPAFAREVANYLLIIKEIRSAEERAFSEKVKGWEKGTERKEGNILPLRKMLAIAATVLILAVASGYFIFEFSSGPTNDELFALYFQPYEDVISERSGGKDTLQQGMDLYNQGKYSEAIPYLEKQMAKNPKDPAVTCYLGISCLADGKIAKAENLMTTLVHGEPGLFTEIAEWNLALIYLKKNEQPLLRKQLLHIGEQKEHLYSNEAVMLLEKL